MKNLDPLEPEDIEQRIIAPRMFRICEFEFDKFLGLINLWRVRYFKTIFILLMALGWVPLTFHCQLEAVTGWSVLHCETSNEHASESHSHCDATGCCSWESGKYQPSQNHFRFSPPNIGFSLLADIARLEHIPHFRTLTGNLISVPPDTPEPWQFLCRAALLPRSPTIAS